jgi:hypothetical protein
MLLRGYQFDLQNFVSETSKDYYFSKRSQFFPAMDTCNSSFQTLTLNLYYITVFVNGERERSTGMVRDKSTRLRISDAEVPVKHG